MASISTPSNTRWDITSRLQFIPFSTPKVNVHFEKASQIADAEVYIECVKNDSPSFKNGVYTANGGYVKGDLIRVSTLQAILNGAIVSVVNSTPNGITVPTKVGGDPKDTFVIKENTENYRMRVFANHTRYPQEELQNSQSYWDEIKEMAVIATGRPHYEMPHSAGVVPAIVEVNIIMLTDTSGGLKAGDVIPLKSIGGKQHPVTGQPYSQQASWSVSADKDKVYIKIWSGTGPYETQASIAFPSIKSPRKLENLLIVGQAKWQVCIKHIYPNPTAQVFPTVTFASSLADTANPHALVSPHIPVSPLSGKILEINATLHDMANPGVVYYYNQCGGTRQGGYEKLNSALVSKRVTPATGDPYDIVFLKFNGTKGDGAGVYIYVGGVNPNWRFRNPWLKSGTWAMKFEWQYEGGVGAPTVDTGWQYLEKNGLYYPKFNKSLSYIWDNPNLPSKLDLYLSINGVDDSSGTTNDETIIGMSTLKGGGLSLRDHNGYVAWNNFAIVMRQGRVIMGNSSDAEGLQGETSIPGVPNTSSDSATYQCKAFDTWAGASSFRMCMHK